MTRHIWLNMMVLAVLGGARARRRLTRERKIRGEWWQGTLEHRRQRGEGLSSALLDRPAGRDNAGQLGDAVGATWVDRRLLAPPDAVAATRRLYETGPVTGLLLADVVVFGKFIGEQEGLAVDRASGAVVLVPELPNVDEGVVVARDLVEFLRAFRQASGRKYWE